MKIKIICARCGKDRNENSLPWIDSNGDLIVFLMSKCECQKEGEEDGRGSEPNGE